MEQQNSTNEQAYKEYAAKIASDLIPNTEKSISVDEVIEEFKNSEFANKV